LIDVERSDARFFKEHPVVEVGTYDMGVREVVAPHSERSARYSSLTHVVGHRFVGRADTAFKDEFDAGATMFEQLCIDICVTVRRPRIWSRNAISRTFV
jgi:hypothetical protein